MGPQPVGVVQAIEQPSCGASMQPVAAKQHAGREEFLASARLILTCFAGPVRCAAGLSLRAMG
jgi:hypothetical protein